jgi:hypothetical protein
VNDIVDAVQKNAFLKIISVCKAGTDMGPFSERSSAAQHQAFGIFHKVLGEPNAM